MRMEFKRILQIIYRQSVGKRTRFRLQAKQVIQQLNEQIVPNIFA